MRESVAAADGTGRERSVDKVPLQLKIHRRFQGAPFHLSPVLVVAWASFVVPRPWKRRQDPMRGGEVSPSSCFAVLIAAVLRLFLLLLPSSSSPNFSFSSHRHSSLVHPHLPSPPASSSPTPASPSSNSDRLQIAALNCHLHEPPSTPPLQSSPSPSPPPRRNSDRLHPMPSLIIPGASSFSAMAADEGLFPSYLVSPDVSAALPEGYKLRPLRRSDYDTGFLDCLRVLTTVGDIAKDEFEAQYERMVKQEGYYIIVIEDDAGAVVATGALIVERKFIHNLGAVGHIEDIAVSKSQQGKKLGLRLIQALDFVAERIGCYKSILDCSDANEGFYIKCGFRRAGLQMAHYYEGSKSKPQ
ncbi:hypothetical protein Purlil1_3436 [Purpureocillium lilacinum]|uniref:Glucosamine 6-phosphate N-acetyltransferase n=2 Tax=Purpureocillium lilacinum TaxID=33203 RepID=A0ABR0C897_PURLI|nr:hypothetical protein Purlil1_3436 [Purpureocillium lilacinum]